MLYPESLMIWLHRHPDFQLNENGVTFDLLAYYWPSRTDFPHPVDFLSLPANYAGESPMLRGVRIPSLASEKANRVFSSLVPRLGRVGLVDIVILDDLSGEHHA
jgi:hypothetical protein